MFHPLDSVNEALQHIVQFVKDSFQTQECDYHVEMTFASDVSSDL